MYVLYDAKDFYSVIKNSAKAILYKIIEQYFYFNRLRTIFRIV